MSGRAEELGNQSCSNHYSSREPGPQPLGAPVHISSGPRRSQANLGRISREPAARGACFSQLNEAVSGGK